MAPYAVADTIWGLYQVRGNPKALATAERALAAAPDNPAVMDTVGWILVEKGDLDKALPLLREAAKALPELPQTRVVSERDGFMASGTLCTASSTIRAASCGSRSAMASAPLVSPPLQTNEHCPL